MTTLKISELIAQLEKYKARVGDLDVFMADASNDRLDGAGKVFVVQSMSGGDDVEAGEGFIANAPSGEYITLGQNIGAMQFE